MSNQNPANKLVSLRSEIYEICQALTQLEAQEAGDRCYTTIDLIEAIELTIAVFRERLNDIATDRGEFLTEWKGDEHVQYASLFHSIKEQLIMTITNAFKTKKGKSMRFVNSFNTLIVERIADLAVVLGPSATRGLMEPILTQLVEDIGNIEEMNTDHITSAHELLAQHRRDAVKPKIKLNPTARLDYIRGLFERLQEAA